MTDEPVAVGNQVTGFTHSFWREMELTELAEDGRKDGRKYSSHADFQIINLDKRRSNIRKHSVRTRLR